MSTRRNRGRGRRRGRGRGKGRGRGRGKQVGHRGGGGRRRRGRGGRKDPTQHRSLKLSDSTTQDNGLHAKNEDIHDNGDQIWKIKARALSPKHGGHELWYD